MDDLDFDRELRGAMAAIPSPEFVARVRAKLADAPAPSIVPGWFKPAAAIACAGVVAIVVAVPREYVRPKSSPAEMTPVIAGLKPSTTYAPPSSASVVMPTFRSAKPLTPASPEPLEPPLPEVIVATEDVEALRRFLTDAHDLRFVASFDETPASTPWVMTELSVAPIGGDGLNPVPSQNN